MLAASQFNESDFFIRYLASEAGVPVKVLRDLDARPAPGELGLVFYEDAVVACDAYASVLASGSGALNGCVGWSPRTDQVVAESAGLAKMLVSNRNLLIVSDLLLVNKGFADAQPQMVEGLVYGLLEGNRRLREAPAEQAAVVASAFGWTEAETLDELSKVHFSNLPENRAFFEGTIDAAGSFQGIFQSSVLVYGDLIRKRYPQLEKFNHIHHAGNSSGVVDGAAAILLASKQYAEKNGLKPRARIVATANMGDCPTLMLNAPVPAAKKVLQKAGMKIEDIDLFEINEAFAVVAEKFIRDLKLDREKVNVNGGAMALGHPIGATGSILIGTVLDELERRDLRYGLVTMCAAGGMAPAVIIERLK